MSVYKSCDIRGPVAALRPELYQRWGAILGRRVAAGDTFVVGGDVRLSTPEFKAALSEGLRAAGARVLDLGILPTPMVYFAKRRLRAAGCAIVTASHNPPQINGLKWMIGDLPVTEADVAALRRDTAAAEPLSPRPPGTLAAGDIAPEYLAWLQVMPYWHGVHPALHVIIDAGNGCWSERAAAYAQAIFPALRIEAIHDVADGRFPHRHADVARPAYLHRLCAEVVARGADIGIAFDGDGDRVAFVDDGGHALSAEEATWVLLLSCWPGLRDRAFVYDIKFSDRMAEGARVLGGEPHMERSGHAFIRRRMLDEGGIFGAEISGHYFYGDLDGGDDGLYTALRMLAHLTHAEQSLHALRRTCPPIFMTPDLRLPLDAAARRAALAAVCAAFADDEQVTIDGIRIERPGGWALVRSSVTEPALTFRFEGHTADSLHALVRDFCARVPAVGEALWEQYRSPGG